jgi:hypothetical protein
VEDGVAIRRPVQTGLAANGLVEITSGIDDKDNIITVGQVGLKPDAKVTVINAVADPPADSTEDTESVTTGQD